MIEIQGLTKRFKDVLALDHLNLKLDKGDVFGYIGPNGAGKTTTMKLITTYLSQNSGKIFVDGIDTETDSLAVRKKIGYLPEQNPLYSDMNVIDYLKYAAELQSVEKTQINDSVKKMVRVCGLEDVKHKDIGELSKGFRQRVGLAQAMIHSPEVILLDEPTSGLDPNQIIEIRKLIKDLGKQKTVILSTHILQEVQAVCDRVIIINNGEIVADGTTDSLQKKFQGQLKLSLTIKKDPKAGKEKILSLFEAVNGVEKVKVVSDDNDVWNIDIMANKGSDVRDAVFKKVVSSDMVLLNLHQEETSLEDIFRKLTTH